MSTDLVRSETRFEVSAYERFSERERALLQRTVAPNTTPEELLMFLSLCAMNNLDPFAREAWAIKMPGRNGAEGRLVMIVGKYGWLKVVERHPDYRGTLSGVVHEHDSFKVKAKPQRLPTGQWTYVSHEYDVTADRGRLLGAYSEVHREGRLLRPFFAKLEQYQPFSTEQTYPDMVEHDFHGIKVYLGKRDFHSPWLDTTDTMIEKSAQTTSWRNAFPLGAIYGEEEMSSAMRPTEVDVDTSVEESIEWGEDPDVAQRMRDLFAAANEASPRAYSDAKIMLMLAGKSDEERFALAANELIPFIRDHGGTVPEPQVIEDGEFEESHPVEREGDGSEQEPLAGV